MEIPILSYLDAWDDHSFSEERKNKRNMIIQHKDKSRDSNLQS